LGVIDFETPNNVQISGGIITIEKSIHVIINTEANASTDDLDTINGGEIGQIIVLKAFDSGRTVVVKHATGNIRMSDKVDFSLDHTTDSVTLMYDGSFWVALSTSNNNT